MRTDIRGLFGKGHTVSLFRRLARYVSGHPPLWDQANANGLLDSLPDGIVIVDAQGEIVAVNSQAEVLFGYGRQELLGQTIEILIPSRFTRLHGKHRTSFFAEPRLRPMGSDLELLGKRKSGAEFPVEISLSPLRTARGLYVTSAIRDVTKRKHAEEQIKNLNAELAEALRRAERLGASGELATAMARDIETSLDSLVRLLGQLERSPAEEERKELIVKAREEVSRISSISSNTLALEKQHEAWKKA